MNRTMTVVGQLAACAALAVMTGACAKGQKGGPPPRPPIAVQMARAEQMDAPKIINAFGNTKERASVDIVPQVSGTLLKTLVSDGAVVTNGQPLFVIDPSDYAARVHQVEAAIVADRANLELSRLTLERNLPLREKELISQQDLDTLKTRADAAKAQLQADEAALDAAQLSLSRCTIAAPLAGLCSKHLVDNGNLVTAGLTRLINIRSYDPIYVEFSVSEEYLPLLRQAMSDGPLRVDVMPRGETNRYAGTLDFLDNAVSLPTGTILLRGQVPNGGRKLWAQQFIEVNVVAGVTPNAVMVPEGAVQFGKQGQYLFAVGADNKAEMRPVKTGVRYQNLIQILQGVSPGENVIVLGQLMMYPGATVMDASHPPQAPAAGGGQGGK